MRILVFLLLISGCVYKLPYTGNAGVAENESEKFQCEEGIRAKVVRCMMTFITGGDTGGVWSVVIKPSGSDIETRLVGTNPCIEWSAETCGRYRFYYIVGDPCCRDTAIVNLTRCCVAGSINCN